MSPSPRARTSHAVVLRIDALKRHAAEIERRCITQQNRTALREAVVELDEAHAWLRAATAADPVLVTHVAGMVNAACSRLYTVARQVP